MKNRVVLVVLPLHVSFCFAAGSLMKFTGLRYFYEKIYTAGSSKQGWFVSYNN
jgi:hypothetical protein